MKLKLITCIVFVWAMISSCTFVIDGENFVQVPNESISTINIALENLSDTIRLIQPMRINYDLSFPKEVRFIVKVMVGDVQVHESDIIPGSFDITPFQFADGFYSFHFQVITNSGTNSLADHLGYEAVLFEVTKVVWVEKSPPVKINLTSIDCENGNLIIRWEKYPKINFRKYILYRNVLSEDGRAPTLGDLFTINNQSQTSFVDPSYMGGQATYYMVTQVTTSTQSTYGDEKQYNSERVKIRKFETVNGELQITWNKSKFFNAFQSYLLKVTGDYMNPLFQSTQVNDTIFKGDQFGFGKAVEVELTTTPVNAVWANASHYSTYQEISFGNKFHPYKSLVGNSALHLVYFYNSGYLYVARLGESSPYDSVQLELNSTLSRRPSIGISRNGQFLYVGAKEMLMQLDPYTLEMIKEKKMSDVIPISNSRPYSIAVGDQNFVSVDVKIPAPLYELGYYSSFIAMLDGQTLTVKDTVKTIADLDKLTGNRDLTYLYESNSIYTRLMEFRSGQEVRRKRFYPEQLFGDGHFSSTAFHVFAWYKNRTVSLSDFSVVAEQDYPIDNALFEISVDPVAEEIGVINKTANGDWFVTYSISPMKEIKKTKLYSYAYNDALQGDNRFIYQDGVLYAGRGYRLDMR